MSAFVVACGDDDSTSSSSSGSLPDSGKAETSTGTSGGTSGTTSSGGTDAGDAGPKDSGSDADAGPKAPPAKLQLVNAAADFGGNEPAGGLRICYRAGPDLAHAGFPPVLPPLPNRKSPTAPYPGLFIGTGGAVEGGGTPLGSYTVVPYILSGASLEARHLGTEVAAGKDLECGKILGTDGSGDPSPGVDAGFAPLKKDKDFWVLDPIPVGAFADGNSYILALTGCTADAEKTVAQCGPGFTHDAAGGKGNLTINIFKVDNTTKVDADKIGLQFVNTSASLDALLPDAGGGVDPAVIDDIDDAGGNPKHFAATTDGGDAGGPVALLHYTSLLQVSGVDAGADLVTPSLPALTVNKALAIAFPTIKLLTYGALADGGANTPTGGDYVNGKAFTVIALGDPSEPATIGGNFNTRTYHLLMLPNDPVSKIFDPAK